MVVLCEDNYYREFIPAVLPQARDYGGKPAYCKHCGTKFRVLPSHEQKEEWKTHSCYGYKSKKVTDSK